jgi:hypothetical protein
MPPRGAFVSCRLTGSEGRECAPDAQRPAGRRATMQINRPHCAKRRLMPILQQSRSPPIKRNGPHRKGRAESLDFISAAPGEGSNTHTIYPSLPTGHPPMVGGTAKLGNRIVVTYSLVLCDRSRSCPVFIVVVHVSFYGRIISTGGVEASVPAT